MKYPAFFCNGRLAEFGPKLIGVFEDQLREEFGSETSMERAGQPSELGPAGAYLSGTLTGRSCIGWPTKNELFHFVLYSSFINLYIKKYNDV